MFSPSALNGIQKNNISLLDVGGIEPEKLDSLKKIIEENSDLGDVIEEGVKIDSETLPNLDQNNPPPLLFSKEIIDSNAFENETELTEIQNNINETILQLKSDSIDLIYQI